MDNFDDFSFVLRRFAEQINALDDLADNVSPHLDELRTSPSWGKKVRESLKVMEPDKRKVAVEVIPLIPEMWFAFMQGDSDEVENIRNQINAVSKDFSILSSDGSLQFATKDRELSKPIMDAVEGVRKDLSTPPQIYLLRRSLLAMVVGTFEVLMGDLLREHLRMHKTALNSETKEFSLSELLEYDSLEDAVEALISRRVDDFTRKGIEDWSKWFGGSALNLSMKDSAGDWLKTREVFERRNLVVHHNCIVSQQYVSKVPKELLGDLMRGDHLDVSKEYLSEAIELLLQLGLALGVRVWVKLTKNYGEATRWLIDRQLEYIERGHPSIALHLGSAIDLKQSPAATQLAIKVNCWIARKETDGLQSVQSEIEAWDAGQLALVYKVAKWALLDEFDEAERGVRLLLERDELDIVDFRDWPLFKHLRATGRVDDLLTSTVSDSEILVAVDATSSDKESSLAVTSASDPGGVLAESDDRANSGD